eukprot:4730274-Amphidinium_carterae.1
MERVPPQFTNRRLCPTCLRWDCRKSALASFITGEVSYCGVASEINMSGRCGKGLTTESL